MISLKKNPIGIYEKALPTNISWRERLELAKKIGFDFVEMSIDESDERIARLDFDKKERLTLVTDIIETGITIPSICLSAHRRFPLGSLDKKTRDRGFEIFKKAIEFAVDIGVRTIQVAGYDVYYEDSNEKTKELFLDGLKKSLELAASNGVMLAVEVMDYEYMGSTKKVVNLVNHFNSPFFKAYPDFGNISAWDNDLAEDLEMGDGHIVAIHLKDTVKGVYRRVPFGEGTVDFVKGFKQLVKMNYQGPFLVEMWTDDADDVEIVLKDALNWIKEKMKLGGLS